MLKLTTSQKEAIDFMFVHSKHGALENGMGVNLRTIRTLEKLGLVTFNVFYGQWEESKRITHWNARLTEAGFGVAKQKA